MTKAIELIVAVYIHLFIYLTFFDLLAQPHTLPNHRLISQKHDIFLHFSDTCQASQEYILKKR